MSAFPNFHISLADFPNSEGPAPIPKIPKRNTVKQDNLREVTNFVKGVN